MLPTRTELSNYREQSEALLQGQEAPREEPLGLHRKRGESL